MHIARVGVALAAIGLSVSGTVNAEPMNLSGGFVVLADEGSFFRLQAPGIGVGTDNFAVTVTAGVIPDPVGKAIASSTFQLVNGGRRDQFDAPPLTFITPEINPAAPAPVPEPATMVLIGTGLLGIARITRRRPQKTKT